MTPRNPRGADARTSPPAEVLPLPSVLSRRRLLVGGLAAGSLGLLTACGSEAALQVDTSGTPRKGGTLRVGLTGGSTADTMDPHVPVNTADGARSINVFDRLVDFDHDYKIVPNLAEKLEPDATATSWTVTLRKEAKFSDGRPVTAADVKATIERIVDPKSPKNMAGALTMYKGADVVDERTLRVNLSQANATLDDTFAQYSFAIVPQDFDVAKPVGSGPFKLKSFSPGQTTVLERNENYWGQAAHLDEIQLLNFTETDAAINALLSSQVDCVGQIPSSLVEVIKSDARLEVLESDTGRWLPFTMRVDVAPFDDVRVRQAFRLVANRGQMIEQVLSGHGQHGNDMFGPFDPGTPKDLVREQDVEQAKKLLAEAGHPNGLTVTLNTAPIQSGVVEAAQVFAEQAKAAGITVKINKMDTTAFFGDQYLKWDFAQSFWNTRNFISQARDCATPSSPFNETHWTDAQFLKDLDAAQGELDPTRRNELVGKLQKKLYDEGGYLIWGFPQQVDAYQSYVVGLQKDRTGLPLGGYHFRDVWLGEVKS